MEFITEITTPIHPSRHFEKMNGVDDVDGLEDDLENDENAEDDEDDEFATDDDEDDDDDDEEA